MRRNVRFFSYAIYDSFHTQCTILFIAAKRWPLKGHVRIIFNWQNLTRRVLAKIKTRRRENLEPIPKIGTSLG